MQEPFNEEKNRGDYRKVSAVVSIELFLPDGRGV
jgi:hypothetical protein